VTGARFVGAVVVMLAALWASLASGFVSSNDGSHVALARALVLRGETSIDPEIGLTLWVDRAHRQGHDYSDRPPGTAFAALLAARLGAFVDPTWYATTLARIEENADRDIDTLVVVRPATEQFMATYGKRRMQFAARTPNLIELQGTAVAVTIHAAVVGALGLWGVVFLLRRRGVDTYGQLFAAASLGLGTLWGPYSTMLFNHVTAGTSIVLMLLALDHLRDAESTKPRLVFGGLAGLAGAWAIAADYALLVAVVPLVLAESSPRNWLPVAVGALPIVAFTLAYHQAAFGSPFAIGYDYQANFGFSRERTTTFDGNPVQGAWTLFGFGHDGAGILALSPIAFIGLGGLALAGRRRWLLALAPWAILLTFHATPSGGAGSDHRYLIPALGPAAVGLGMLWQRFATAGDRRALVYAAIFVGLALVSSGLVWVHFFAWRGP
jgi:hypothetical protein